MKLWPLNTEFDIEISYPYTFNFPFIRASKDGKIIIMESLRDSSVMDIINRLLKEFPDSEFLNKLIKQTLP